MFSGFCAISVRPRGGRCARRSIRRRPSLCGCTPIKQGSRSERTRLSEPKRLCCGRDTNSRCFCGAVATLPDLTFDRSVPWSPWGWYLAQRPSFTLDTDFHAGAYYVQEPSSQFVGHLLQNVPTAGARILDLCAAPGGKTTLYASLVGADGLVVANEIDRRRAAVLADNVRKWGMGNTIVTVGEPRPLGDCKAFFDVVAVDAPCSGEGMFRKDIDSRAEWSENNVHQCARRQDEILREAWRALRVGGTLIYSTCTFNREEDEGSLERMLAWAGDEVVSSNEVAIGEDWGIVCGEVGPFRTYRFYPHRACGEGFSLPWPARRSEWTTLLGAVCRNRNRNCAGRSSLPPTAPRVLRRLVG